jgi:hypothetical protein
MSVTKERERWAWLALGMNEYEVDPDVRREVLAAFPQVLAALEHAERERDGWRQKYEQEEEVGAGWEEEALEARGERDDLREELRQARSDAKVYGDMLLEVRGEFALVTRQRDALAVALGNILAITDGEFAVAGGALEDLEPEDLAVVDAARQTHEAHKAGTLDALLDGWDA